MRWRSLLCGMLLSCCPLSCGDDADLPPLRFETDHFRYHARSDVEVCEGLGAWLEHHYRTVGGALDAELPAADKIDIYVFSDRNDLTNEVCPPESYGCAGDRVVYQYVPFMPHELIHAYVRLVADPPELFEEALAYVLGCGPGVEAVEIDRVPEAIQAGLTTVGLRGLAPAERERAQSAANGFVRFLIDGHGLGRVMEFVGGVGRDATRSGIELVFSRAFGVTLDSALASWAAGPPQTEIGICLHLAECATEALHPAATVDLAPACVYGISTAGFLPWSVIRTLSVNGEAGVVVEVGSLAIVSLRGCDVPLLPAQGDLLLPQEGRRHELWSSVGPGRYWLLAGSSDRDLTVRVRTEPPLFGDRCADSPVRRIASETSSVRAFGALSGAADDDPEDGVPDLAATLALDADRRATVLRLAGEAFLCADGCPTESPACSKNSLSSALGAGSASRLVVQGGDEGYALRIDFEP